MNNNSLPNNIMPQIANRRSSRFVSSKDIEHNKLKNIFEAAIWAPSAYNLQPWYFIVGFRDDDVYNNIFSSLMPGNQAWVKNSPVLAASISCDTNAENQPNPTSWYDLGQAMAMLSVQATEEGLFVHQMTGFDKEKLTNSLNIPENHTIVTVFNIFYLGDGEGLRDAIKKIETSPRTRRNIKETVFTGKFGNGASFL